MAPMPSPTAHLHTKRSLLALSHAMERSLDVGRTERDARRPPLVIALFQRAEYFAVERDRYRDMSACGALCIVGFAGVGDAQSEGVSCIDLAKEEPLAGEWALIVLDGAMGISLVAYDINDIAPGEQTLESARLFTAQWSFSPTDTAREARRILEALGERVPETARARALAVIAESERVTPTITERRLAAVTELMVASIDIAHNRSARLGEQLRRERVLSEQDPLTGLHNRLFLERFLNSPVSDSPVTVTALLVDLDGLKIINDTLGHAAGDAALSAVADALVDVTRPQDVVVRLGGDEFLVVLPGMDASSGVRVGERIVRHLAATRLAPPWEDLSVSASVGVAEAEPNRIPIAQLDEALYRVKRSGKGRVCLVGDAA
jgi:diguanylate cyclase (GGDEF)-like protein